MMVKDEKGHIRIKLLFQKYLKGECSPDELPEIYTFFENSAANQLMREMVRSQWYTINSEIIEDIIPVSQRRIIDQILDQLHHRIRLSEEQISKSGTVNRPLLPPFTKAAFVCIVPLLICSIFQTLKMTSLLKGETIPELWQTIKTPAGMQTNFLLPDGSHVWLNSGSAFRYPSRFVNGKRQVELSGEAYFEIVRQISLPFLVKAGKMNIEVKGTKFNVMNYPDDTPAELVLKTGGVRLFSGKFEDNNTIAYIKPGERAVLDLKKNRLTVSRVNVDHYTAWKEGLLIFRDDRMDDVVRKLSRWFNVQIVLCSSELKQYHFTATYRDETLLQVLELLRNSAPVSYKISDRVRLDDNSYSKRKIVLTKPGKKCLWEN